MEFYFYYYYFFWGGGGYSFFKNLTNFEKFREIWRCNNFQVYTTYLILFICLFYTLKKILLAKFECKMFCIFKFLRRRKKIQRNKMARDPSLSVDRLKRDIKFIQSHDGGAMVCYHKIALYNVEYLPEQNKIWLYKFQRRFLRDRPAHLG